MEASADIIKTFKRMQWSGSARYSKHRRHLTDTLTEFTGVEPDTISFDMELSAYLGVDPMADISKIWNYERTGKAVTLVIGEKAYGKYKWTVESHKINSETHDKYGDLTSVTVSVNLLEYLKS